MNIMHATNTSIGPHRVLRVFVGGHPQDKASFQRADNGVPVMIDTPGFRGSIAITLRPSIPGSSPELLQQQMQSMQDPFGDNGKMHGPFRRHHRHRARHQPYAAGDGAPTDMALQVMGSFKPPPTGMSHWSMDDVMFGIELDQPFPVAELGIPRWIVKLAEGWMPTMDAALLVQNVYHNGTPTSNARPTILTPLVCAATTMNAWPTATGEGGDAQFYVNGSGSSNQQTQWEREHIAAPHPRWVISPVTGDYELTEYNAWMWHGFQPPIGAGLDARSRRALYRPSDGVPQPTPEHFPQSVRRQHHGFEASPDTTHAFEFYSDYFDATTFIVQPTFAQRKDISDNPLYSHSLTTLIQQSPLARQLTQCWSLDVYRGLADAQGVARVYIVCRSKPMGPVGAVIYFWTIVLELAMEM